jgi:hypothetical protein
MGDLIFERWMKQVFGSRNPRFFIPVLAMDFLRFSPGFQIQFIPKGFQAPRYEKIQFSLEGKA